MAWKKTDNKKSAEELQEYLAFRRRGSTVKNKKAYNRKEKYKKNREQNDEQLTL